MQSACQNGSLETVKSLIEDQGHNVNSIPGSDWTPIIYATYYDQPAILRYLIQKGANANGQLNMGATAVFVACEHQKLASLKVLIEEGRADPNLACNASGCHPFLKCCENGNLDIVKYMVEDARCNMNQQQTDGATGFFMACQHNRLAVVNYLCDQGVDADVGKRDSATPIIVASELGHTEVVRSICTRARSNKSADTAMYNGVTPLYKACEHGHFEIVKTLVDDAGVDPDKPKNDGVSPLFTACQMGHLNIIQFLADRGADVNKAKNDGVVPVYMAAEYRNVAIVEELLRRGADLARASANGLTPLHAACIQHEPRTVAAMLRAGADPNARDNGGFPPLCNASEWGRDAVVDALLRARGLDPGLAGWNGNNALHLAAWKGKRGVVQKLLGTGLFGGGGMDINVQNNYGFSPLHLAALGGHGEIVRLLLDKKADPNLQNCNGDTALHCAAERGHGDIAEMICAARALAPRTNLLGLNATEAWAARWGSPPAALARTLAPRPGGAAAGQGGQQIPAAKFVETAREVMGMVALENVLLLRRGHYLQAGEMPHYDRCQQQGWHTDARVLGLADKVLFISHRWGAVDHPDPTAEQYGIVKRFLESADGSDIEYIWGDYSCICQDRTSMDFGKHLQNIPTAVWTATHCLIVPQLMTSPYNNDPTKSASTTHLTDYLGRAWCLLEAMAAMLTGTKCFLSFQVGASVKYQEFDRPEGAASMLGFFMSYVKTWNALFAEKQPDMMAIDLNRLEEQWRSPEPCAILGLLIRIAKSQDPAVRAMLRESLNLGLTLEDLNANVSEINELWNNMGQCSVPEDKMVVLNLMLFIGYYSMNLYHAEPDAMGGEEGLTGVKQRGELLATFQHFDTDNSGGLDLQEFKNLLISQGNSNLSDFDIEILLEDVDLNNDGVVDFEEFCQMMLGSGRHAMPLGEGL